MIRTSGLSKTHGQGVPALSGLDLTVHEGERVAIIGPNGAGKSTLLKCLIGLWPSSAGEVTILGESFSRAPTASQRARLRRQIGFVFQNHGLVRRRSVLSNVVHGHLGLPGSWRAFSHVTAPAPWRGAAMAALEQVGLAEKAERRADELSGGQAQRVAIARALVRGPRLLIADEPAASLDPAAGRDVMALFADLAAEQGITLLFTSHDMAHSRAFADRVVALRGGRLAFDRPSLEVTDTMLGDLFDG